MRRKSSINLNSLNLEIALLNDDIQSDVLKLADERQDRSNLNAYPDIPQISLIVKNVIEQPQTTVLDLIDEDCESGDTQKSINFEEIIN